MSAAFLLLGCAAQVESGRTGEARLPRVVARRVTATVERETLRLVRLETERDSLLTTPEHPFATPGSGWLRAGRLVPGDWLVSGRSGAVQLRSAHSQIAARAVRVFNLSVASSHAYFVGADRVLVHNTKCKPDASAREEEIERALRERAAVNEEIQALTATAPSSPRIAALKLRRYGLTQKLQNLRRAQRRQQRIISPGRTERNRQHFEVDNEAVRQALEATHKELADLESGAPTTDAKQPALTARKEALERQLLTLQLRYERTNRILAWLGELEQLDKDTPATDADRRALEERKQALRENLRLERKRQSHVKYLHKKRADPVGRAEITKYHRERRRRVLRFPIHVADTARPRDQLELLEEELARRLHDPPSKHRDARIDHLTERIDTTKQLVDRRKQHDRIRRRRLSDKGKREGLIAAGQDASRFDGRMEQADLELRALSMEIAQLRARERLLAQLGATPWADGPGSVDEARLREFERQLAEGLGNEQAPTDIEPAPEATELSYADWEAVLAEADDVDALLSEREELTQQGPSPERAVGFESSYERLERELREERAAVEVAVSALVNEAAHIQTTQASSSSGVTWQERLRRVQEEQGRLRAHWRAGLRARVDSARRQLHLLRSFQVLHDEAVVVELARQVALLERELQSAGE